MKDFVEQEIIYAVKKLLSGRANELLSAMRYQIPLIEFAEYNSGSVISPVITFLTSEQTEKERILKLDTYSLTITFKIPETKDSELFCYAYSGVVSRVIYENPTLGGEVDRVVINGKKYLSPKKPYIGECWELVITLRVTVEGNSYVD